MNEIFKDKKINRTDSEDCNYMELKQRIKEMELKHLEKTPLYDPKLPWWSDDQRGVPTSFLRYGLYSLISNEDVFYKDEPILPLQNGISIKYTGRQLSQYDLELWENLVHLMRHKSLGTTFEFTLSTVLKETGLSANANTYQRVKQSISKMVVGTIDIKCGEVGYLGSLFNGLGYNERTMKISISLNPQLIELYSFGNWIAINRHSSKTKTIETEQAQAILPPSKSPKTKPLYKFLEGYYLSHKIPVPIFVMTIYEMTGSTNKQQSGFKRDLKKALELLVSNNILSEYEIDKKNKVHVKR